MSTENITKFTEAVSASPDLQAKLQEVHLAAARQTAEQLAALSAETDAPFTAEEFLGNAQSQIAELSDEQLESVAGGAWNPNVVNITMSIASFGFGCIAFAIVSASSRNPDTCQPSDIAKSKDV